jgi:hypothetical protein
VKFPDIRGDREEEIENWDNDQIDVIPLGDQVLKRYVK